MPSKENHVYTVGDGIPPLSKAEVLGLWGDLQERKREFTEIIPRDRNFFIECGQTANGTSIALLSITDRAWTSLNRLLADRYGFAEGSVFLCDAGAQKVFYPPRELPYRGAILNLLHEIAHTHQEGTKYTFHSSVIDTALDYAYETLFMMGNPDLAAQVLSGKLSREAVMRKKTIDTRHQLKTQWEREAWEHALHMTKALQKD